MGADTARRAETAMADDELEFLIENCYGTEMLERCRKFFRRMTDEGTITGNFDDDEWVLNNDVGRVSLSFGFDEKKYKSGTYRFLKIEPKLLSLMLKCRALCDVGVLAKNHVHRNSVTLIRFLEEMTKSGFRLDEGEAVAVMNFLKFISTPAETIRMIEDRIRLKKTPESGAREMPSLISLLCLSDAAERVMRDGSEDEKLSVFPIYFFTHVPMIIPLRAMETMVTPLECVTERDGKLYIHIRRTKLKKKDAPVYYSVEKDYEVEEYEVPRTETIENVLWYQERTADHPRRFLFDYDEEKCPLKMLSLSAFNRRIAVFTETYLIGNRRYDFARHAAGVKEFEIVTAGDSRPVALSNLYFQGVSVDACRRLAGHENAETTAGYWSNVSRTLEASAIMKIQKEMLSSSMSEEEARRYKGIGRELEQAFPGSDSCLSPKRRVDPGDVSDCMRLNRLEDCWGCPYYRCSEAEVEERFRREKELADRSAERLADFVRKTAKIKQGDLDKILLDLQTASSRYRDACYEKYGKEAERWREQEERLRTVISV